jgi:hypothetical protein
MMVVGQLYIYLYNRRVLVCSLVYLLVADYLLSRDFWPNGIIFLNVDVVITVAMVMLLRDCGPYDIIFMMCVATLESPSFLTNILPVSSQ